MSRAKWSQTSDEDNSLGVVPVFALVNEPGPDREGRSALEPVVPVVDAINKLTTDLIVASEFQAFSSAC